MQRLVLLAAALTFISMAYACAPANTPCALTLPNPRDATGVQFNPAPKCTGTSCTFASGVDSTVNVNEGQICSNYHSGEFSLRGPSVNVAITNDPYHTRLTGSCIGFEPDAWWAMGRWRKGVDYAPRTFTVSCKNGILTGKFNGQRECFNRPDANPQFLDGSVTGFNTIQCSACNQNNDALQVVTLGTVVLGPGNADIFAIGGANAGACVNNVCTLPGQSITTEAGDTVTLTYIGGCGDNLVRIVGTTLDGTTGDSAGRFPDTFSQVYQSQATCVTLDMNPDSGTMGEGVNAEGLTYVNVQDEQIFIRNDHGVADAFFTADFTTGGGVGTTGDEGINGPNLVTQAYGGVERIECGTCPSNQNNG